MIYIIVLMLLVMAFLFGMAIACLILEAKEKADLKRQKKRDLFKARQKKMCEATRAWGSCPGVCEKCAWGRDYGG